MNPDEWSHGSHSTYVNHKCRCQPCRDAQAAYMRMWRQRNRGNPEGFTLPHGRLATYTNWGCRCEDCKAANTRQLQQWKRRR